MADYKDKTKEELLEEARERDLKGRSSMDKDELAKALEEDDSSSDESSSESGNASAEGEAPAASNQGEGSGEPRSGDSDAEHVGFASEASDEDNPEVVEELSDTGQEALEDMEPKQAELADLALDASGPLILQSPKDRIATGAVSEDHAKELAGILKDLPEDHVGNVTEAGEFREARKGSGPDGQVMPEDVIDFPPPLQVDEKGRRDHAAGKKSALTDVPTVQTDAAREAFPEDDASGQDRAFNQRSQLHTDGLSGDAGHNLPLSYRVNEVAPSLMDSDGAIKKAKEDEANEKKSAKKSEKK